MNYLTITKLGTHDNFIYFKNIVKKMFLNKMVFLKSIYSNKIFHDFSANK